MFKVGLTGGIGSGKTLVSDRLAMHGAAIIDSDLIARRITAPGGSAIASIAAAFGEEFITEDGALDRTRMRTCVFSDSAARARLEAITHPLIRAETEYEAAQHAAKNAPYLVFSVPLLVESKSDWQARVDRVLVVDCEVDTQIARVIQRSQLPEAQVRAIIASQASREQRLAVAQDILLNEGKSLDTLYQEIDSLHRLYSQLAQAKSR